MSHSSQDAISKGGPYRAPPQQEFVFFSESARVVLECLELNSREGVFVGPLKTRVSSLAVVEALNTMGDRACQVRLVGRVEESFTRPYPLVRLTWLRALSSLPPADVVEVLDTRYGFLIDVNLDRIDPADFEGGTEYDFARNLLIPRGRDSARGDSGRVDRNRTPAAEIRRVRRDTEEETPRERVGVGTTVMLRPDQLDNEFEREFDEDE